MNKILLVGFVCLSLGAFAQSSAGQGQTSNGTTPAASQDAASGQLSGKRMHKPLDAQQDTAAGDHAAGKLSGGKTAMDDWSTGVAKSNGSNSGQAGAHVATGDVNGDGKADLTQTKGSGNATTKNAVMNSSSSTQSPADAASGQASGKRQHEPVTIRKEVDSASPKMVKQTDAASPKTVTVRKEVDAASPK